MRSIMSDATMRRLIKRVLRSRGFTDVSVYYSRWHCYTIWGISPDTNRDGVGRSKVSYGQALLSFITAHGKHKSK